MKQKRISLIRIVREVIRDKKQVTLSELYEALVNHPDVYIKENEIKHRIRSAIYSLNKSGEIQRIGDSTYQNMQYE